MSTATSAASPRRRVSLGKQSSFALPVVPISKQSSSARRGSSKRDEMPVAPRASRFTLLEIRQDAGQTPAQFAAALSAGLAGDTAPINQQQLLLMEMGLALVPAPVLACAERLREQREQQQAAAAAAAAAAAEEQIVGGVYPHQECMLGPEYQVAPPRYVGSAGSSKATSRKDGKDECTYSPYSAAEAGVDVDGYLKRGRELTDGVDELPFAEEVALSILHELGYDGDAALASLELCASWHRNGGGGGMSSTASLRDAAPNSIMWLHRLREAAARRSWSAGEREALDEGVTEHGKQLAVVHQHVLREKSRPELIEMYYVVGVRHQSP